MIIKLQDVYKKLQEYSPIIYDKGDRNKVLVDGEIINSDLEKFHDNVLYMGKASTLQQIKEKVRCGGVFLIEKDIEYDLNYFKFFI